MTDDHNIVFSDASCENAMTGDRIHKRNLHDEDELPPLHNFMVLGQAYPNSEVYSFSEVHNLSICRP